MTGVRRALNSVGAMVAVHDKILVECDEDDMEKAETWLTNAVTDETHEVLNGPESGDAPGAGRGAHCRYLGWLTHVRRVRRF